MTRYARAKGSKASNERTPNDATPWHLMKQQLIENTSKEEKSFEETKTVKELLENTQNTSNNVENDSWAEFPNNYEKKDNFTTKKIKKKQKINEVDNSTIKNKEYQNEYQSNDTSSNKKRKRDKHISEIKDNNTDAVISVNESENKKNKLSKRQKRNMKKRNSNESISKIIENNNDDSTASKNINNNKNESKRIDQPQRRFDKNFSIKSQNFKSVPNKFGTKKLDNQKRKRKPPKIRDDKEHKRRKADLGPSKIIINGVELDIVKFDGFPVRKEDADRLSDLKQKMVMKGRLYR